MVFQQLLADRHVFFQRLSLLLPLYLCFQLTGIGVILAGDFGQLPPVQVAPSHTLLSQNVVHNAREARTANLGLRLFNGVTDVVRFRRVHRQPGASVFKESLMN